MSQGDYSAYAIIQKKRDGKKLSPAEIKWFINGLVSGDVADYQMTALLMAIYLNGFDKDETAAITDAMLYSGEVLHHGPKAIDKHSTGGVGDKASFILAPIAAACGVEVPMMAGRGLGHTGGTVDKIEAIKGYKTDLNLKQFSELLKKNGIVLIGQTGEIAPADKKIYALRDVTATVESIPLITASIMSKKLAEGAAGIVMDIKTGNGAFMSSMPRARALAKSLADTGLRFDRSMMTVISDMSQPLGNAVGNTLEIIESIETLKNNGPKDLTDLSIELAGGMVHLAGLVKTPAAGKKLAKRALEDGSALEKFRLMVRAQGGDDKVVDDYSRLPQASEKTEILATKSGYISQMDCKAIGTHCVLLGGGRRRTSDPIDFGVGFIFNKKIGDKIKTGESIVTIHHNKNQTEQVKTIAQAINTKDIKISPRSAKKPELIREVKIYFPKKKK